MKHFQEKSKTDTLNNYYEFFEVIEPPKFYSFEEVFDDCLTALKQWYKHEIQKPEAEKIKTYIEINEDKIRAEINKKVNNVITRRDKKSGKIQKARKRDTPSFVTIITTILRNSLKLKRPTQGTFTYMKEKLDQRKEDEKYFNLQQLLYKWFLSKKSWTFFDIKKNNKSLYQKILSAAKKQDIKPIELLEGFITEYGFDSILYTGLKYTEKLLGEQLKQQIYKSIEETGKWTFDTLSITSTLEKKYRKKDMPKNRKIKQIYDEERLFQEFIFGDSYMIEHYKPKIISDWWMKTAFTYYVIEKKCNTPKKLFKTYRNLYKKIVASFEKIEGRVDWYAVQFALLPMEIIKQYVIEQKNPFYSIFNKEHNKLVGSKGQAKKNNTSADFSERRYGEEGLIGNANFEYTDAQPKTTAPIEQEEITELENQKIFFFETIKQMKDEPLWEQDIKKYNETGQLNLNIIHEIRKRAPIELFSDKSLKKESA